MRIFTDLLICFANFVQNATQEKEEGLPQFHPVGKGFILYTAFVFHQIDSMSSNLSDVYEQLSIVGTIVMTVFRI